MVPFVDLELIFIIVLHTRKTTQNYTPDDVEEDLFSEGEREANGNRSIEDSDSDLDNVDDESNKRSNKKNYPLQDEDDDEDSLDDAANNGV